MLLFVGQIPHEDTGREAFQEVDYRQMFGPLAKWVTQIDQAKRIPEVVAHAVDVATSGRPGPVVIALSEEMQRDIVQVPDLPRVAVCAAVSRSGGHARRCARCWRRRRKPLAGARRLLLDAGRAGRRSASSCWRTTSRSPSASAARRITTARWTISPAISASDPIRR